MRATAISFRRGKPISDKAKTACAPDKVAETSVIGNGVSTCGGYNARLDFYCSVLGRLLLLILHDATRDADGGSAVSVASRNALFTAAKGLEEAAQTSALSQIALNLRDLSQA